MQSLAKDLAGVGRGGGMHKLFLQRFNKVIWTQTREQT